MKLEVGQFVRTKDGYISQYKYYDTTNAYMEKLLCIPLSNGTFANIEDIVKASYNIIDILEVGDIIRYRINKVPLETKGYLTGVIDIADEEMLKSIKEDKNYHVLQILTKEKFKEMSYEVVEKDKLI